VSRPLLIAACLASILAGCAALPPQPSEPAAQAAPPTSPWIDGNKLRILVDGPQTHAAMFAAMAAARDHINLETYIIDAGPFAERLAGLLEKKVKQGVKVNLIYDSIGSLKTPQEYFQRLKDAGVAVCEFNPVNPEKAGFSLQINNRDHRKILVVDGRIAYTGGINISDTYRSSSLSARRKPGQEKNEGWRDTQIEVTGPVVAKFQRLFLDAWGLQDCGPFPAARYYPRVEVNGDKTVKLVASDPLSGKSEMYRALLSAITDAKSRVWLTVGYFVPDPQLRQALIDAARRGVDVRLVLPGFSDFWAPVYAARSNYEELLKAGVRIYEWREALMHAKSALVDSSWSSIGSTNLDWRSFVHNYEANLIVHDAAFAREMERRFKLDVAAGVAIDPDQWKRRAGSERFKEWFARQWEYML
jgi:cardiolipin synthase A/B